MPYGELNIPQQYTGRNRKTGRFMKGNVPANKGKKWDEFLSKRKQKRCAKGWKNLDLYRPKGRPDFGALRQKRVIAINDEGRWAVFSSAVAAEKALRPGHPLIRSKYINYCCRENSKGGRNTDHRHQGIRFYHFDTDNSWTTKI